MEQLEMILTWVVGSIIVPMVTKLLTQVKWLAFPFVKWILVIVLSLGASWGAQVIMAPTVALEQVFALAMPIALAAIGLKAADKNSTKLLAGKK